MEFKKNETQLRIPKQVMSNKLKTVLENDFLSYFFKVSGRISWRSQHSQLLRYPEAPN